MSAVPGHDVTISSKDFQPDNSLWKLRPTFQFPIRDDRQTAIEKLRSEFERDNRSKLFLMHGEYGELHLPSAEHRLWSPHLSFYISEVAQGTVINGRFAPRMEVWTFVWILYLVMSFCAFYGLALAYSQIMLSESPWGFLVAAFSLLSIFVLYVIAHVGQHWSADQMASLRSQLDEVLKRAGVFL